MRRELQDRRYKDALVILFRQKEGAKLLGNSFDYIHSRRNSLSNNSTETMQEVEAVITHTINCCSSPSSKAIPKFYSYATPPIRQ